MSSHRSLGGVASGLPFVVASVVTADTLQQLEGIFAAYLKQVSVYGQCWDCILQAREITNECVLVHLFVCDYFLAKNDMSSAVASFKKAQALFKEHSKLNDQGEEHFWTARDAGYMQIFEYMMNGHIAEAFERSQKHLTQFPSDLFIVKKGQLLCFLTGDRPSMIAITERADVLSACGNMNYFHGMRAFGYEENNQFPKARECAEKALSLTQHDPWSHHVLAHVFFAQAELDEGIAWLEKYHTEWSECMSFLYTHNYFHLALLHVDKDQLSRAMQILHQKVWPFDQNSNSTAQQSNPASSSTAAISPTSTTASDAPPSSSTSDSAASPIQHFSDTSFGVSRTNHSFPIHDANYPEDQNAALNLLWRLQVRATCLPPSGSAANDLPLSTFEPLWRSIGATLTQPPAQLTSLYGLLQIVCHLNSGDDATRELGEKALTALREAVQGMPSAQPAQVKSKAQFEMVLVPLAQAIEWMYSKKSIQEKSEKERAHASVKLLQSIFDPAAASEEFLKVFPKDVCPLVCLCASGEQLEVLREWWMSLCVVGEESTALRSELDSKPQSRRERVAWLQRLTDSISK